jgi:hypothetical protein
MDTARASRIDDDPVKARPGVIRMWGAVILTGVVAACAARGPVIGGDPQPEAGGTISGIVRASGDSRLSARKVTAVNLVTGERIETSTAANGGYTMKVARGRYRLEVELRNGETLTSAPGEVEISRSDLDASRDFVITIRD